ncbi:SusC/RagA family TonB-linked outer membrane protein [Sediminicola luteus]|uniref:SusC/RagA family TonB-linked outer membrane protein n=1 Tax=Sediminicola luteus TaxID=319238 RepID=A0A2A4G5C8_9FLAO|nr:SusC/RagA family TonB-linked outer membrane protein [Sediminicola luteus]PCE63631.1 hypothetical protein B7P33_10120 [Sediminicola luteus]
MIKKLLSFLVFVSMLSVSTGYAQSKNVSGTVSDESGVPLPGVSVVVKGQARGASTDFDGNFSIDNVASTDVLVFSFIGFADQEVTVGSQSSFTITLAESAEALDEVVLTALGIEKQAKSIGYAQETVKGEELAGRQENNVIDALKGRVAGVQITNNDAGGGGSVNIVIRGGTNILPGRSDQPLIVVDGVPIQNDDTDQDRGSRRDWGSGINAVNPADIESMEVLKGANAAALYGSRGANGVILITTKKGRDNGGIGITYDFNARFEDIATTRDVQNVYGIGYNGWDKANPFPTNDNGNLAMPGVSYWGSGASWGPEMDGTPVEYYDGVVRPFSPQPNNLKEPYGIGETYVHSVSMQGANEKGSFRASFTDNKSERMEPNNHYDRFNASFNADYNLSSKVTAGLTFNYANIDNLNPRVLGDNDQGWGKALLYNWARSERVQLRMDNYLTPEGTLDPDYRYGRSGGIVWNLLQRKEMREIDRYFGAFTLNWQFTDWLNLMVRTGIDNANEQRTMKQPPQNPDGLDLKYSTGLSKDNSRNSEFLLTGNHQLTDDLGLTANFGGSQYYRKKYGLYSRDDRYWNNPNLYALDNAQQFVNGDRNRAINRIPNEEFWEKKINSLYGTLDFNFKDYLFLQVTGRNDWSSTLPDDANSYFYPSFNSSFVFTDAFQDAFAGMEWLNYGKVRGTWAQGAVDDSPYQTVPTYNIGSRFGEPASFVPGEIPATNLKPQKTDTWEAGLDLGMFNNRVNFNFTYYNKLSENQIMSGPLAWSTGFNSRRFNTGSMRNSGVEITVDATPISTNDFNWNVLFSFSKNKNEVVNLDDSGAIETLRITGLWGSNGPSIEAQPGQPYGQIMGWDFIYDDATGKPLVDEDGYLYTTNTRVALGNVTPDFLSGLINTFTYKDFTFNMIMDAKIGGDTYFSSKGVADGFGQSAESLRGRDTQYGGLSWTDGNGNARTDGMIEDAIVSPDAPVYNPETDSYDFSTSGENTSIIPARHYWAVRSSGWGAGAPTTHSVHENSWIRLTELSLGYNVPRKFLESFFIQNLSFNVFARNVGYLYKTAPDNLNPHSTINGGKLSGIEFGGSPITRTIGFGAKVSF